MQQVANALRRRTKSAAGTQGQLSSGGQLRVTPKSLALFHERWLGACHNHEELMQLKAALEATVTLIWLAALPMPATQVFVSGLPSIWPAFKWAMWIRLVLIALIPQVVFFDMLGRSTTFTNKLRALVGESHSLVCEDPQARIFLTSVCADLPCFRTNVPGTPAVAAAAAMVALASFVPYAVAN